MDYNNISSLDAIDMHVINTISRYLSGLDTQVSRVQWDEEKLRSQFAKRSAEQINKDGTAHYANPCIDLSLVTHQYLGEQKANPGFIIETHFNGDKYSNGSVGMHFAVPFTTSGKNYVLDFRKENEVVLSNKSYENTQTHVEVLSIDTIPFALDPHKNLFDNLEGEFDSSGFDFDAYIDRLVRTSLAEGEFQDYQKRMEKTPRLYLQLDF